MTKKAAVIPKVVPAGKEGGTQHHHHPRLEGEEHPPGGIAMDGKAVEAKTHHKAIADPHHLADGLELAPLVGGHHNPFSSGDGPQAGDCQLPANDEKHHPSGNV